VVKTDRKNDASLLQRRERPDLGGGTVMALNFEWDSGNKWNRCKGPVFEEANLEKIFEILI